MSRVLSSLALLLIAAPVVAQETLPAGAKVAKLESRAASIKLDGAFAYSQLLVTAKLDGGDVADVTRIAKIDAPGHVAVSPTGLVRPRADGTGDITVSLAGKTITIPVTVSGFQSQAPVSFVQDVQPVLSKVGCNAGTCHGAQAGKNGFKLSLRGYDPIYDYRALTDDLEARRFNRA